MKYGRWWAASLVWLAMSPLGVWSADLKAGAAKALLVADDSMVIGGSIGPSKAQGQEGELRASAVVIQDPSGAKVALIACDVLMLPREILDPAARQIEAKTGIPFNHILINTTHTHHAPTTITVHAYKREEAFTHQVGEKVVEAAVAANERLTPVTMLFRLGEESSVGRNSRILLTNGLIFWTGPREDFVRPTGPFDPELPVWAFRRADGTLEAVLFNHSTHTIGTNKPGVRSPSFYGMAAQGLERGGTFIFFEGASGSTHNLDLRGPEMTLRITQAVADALAAAQPRPVARVEGLRREVTIRVRRFDEAKEDKAIVDYMNYRFKEQPFNQFTVDSFRGMRKTLAPQQRQARQTWVQAIRIGDTAIVGVPGEFFTVLGEEIKRRSPFRYTYVFELANDYTGYIPDRRAYELGGYQTWMGLHSFVEPGTGEMMVAESVKLLDQLYETMKGDTSP
jgi:hypothetical protein